MSAEIIDEKAEAGEDDGRASNKDEEQRVGSDKKLSVDDFVIFISKYVC